MNFTPGQRMPTSVVLNYKEGVWLIDSDKTEELAEKNVLTWMVSIVYFSSSISSHTDCNIGNDAREIFDRLRRRVQEAITFRPRCRGRPGYEARSVPVRAGERFFHVVVL